MGLDYRSPSHGGRRCLAPIYFIEMRIYILSTHGEYGAENVVATTHKSVIADLLTKKGIDPKEAIEAIEKDETISENGLDLQTGWGGYQLHILELIN